MKKLISILLLISFTLIIGAQDSETNADITVTDWKVTWGTSSQVISTATDSVFTYTYDLGKSDQVFWYVQQNLDSITGTPDYNVFALGKVHWDQSWGAISDTATWDGTSADTSIYLTNLAETITWTSTGNLDTLVNTQTVTLPDRIRYLQVVIEGQAGTGNAQSTKSQLILFKP
jgi:hypothetical protein